jgi:hypothetical protein
MIYLNVYERSTHSNVLTIQLHIDIEHLVGYNVVLQEIMHRMSDDDYVDDDDDEPCKVWNNVEILIRI